jgi:enolase
MILLSKFTQDKFLIRNPNEVDVVTENGVLKGSSSIRASTGEHEAVELRDGGKAF